jgi:tight adherence protein B
VYDAAAAAVRQIRGTRLRGGFVVVLSDGSDRHSRATPAAVAAAARAAHVRIYTVGLRSRATDFAALQQLAAQSGGGYSEASSASQLRRIYATLGGELSNGYLVRYQSLAATRQVVSVTASVAGLGTAETSYRAPRLAAVAHPAKRSPLWSSPAATLVAAFLVPVLLGTAALLLLGRARRQTPRERVAQFVAPPQREPEGPELAGGLTAGANRSLARSSRWAELAKELDVARISTPPVRALLLAAGGTLGVALVVGVASGEALAGLAALACVPFALRAELRRRVARQQQLFDEQLVDNLTVMASALRAGHSLVGALAAVVDEAPDPTRRELRRVVADERLGAPLEDALAGAVRRMKSQELDQVAMLAVLQRETGGNTAEMLDRVAEGIRQRHELKRMVRSLTAQGRLSHAVITILPLALFFGISLLIPGYMDPMLHTTTGVLLLIIAGAMVAAGSLVIKRIVEIEI